MSNISGGEVGSFSSSGNTLPPPPSSAPRHNNTPSSLLVSASSTISNGSSSNPPPPPPPPTSVNKKKRSLPGTPEARRCDELSSPSSLPFNGHNRSSSTDYVHSDATDTPLLPSFLAGGGFKLNGNAYNNSWKNTSSVFSSSIGGLLGPSSAGFNDFGSAHMSATALLQKATQIGAAASLSSALPQPNCGTKMPSSVSSSVEEAQKLSASYDNPHQHHNHVQDQNGCSHHAARPTLLGGYDERHEISSELLDMGGNGSCDEAPLVSNMGVFNRLLFDQGGLLPKAVVEQGNDPVGLFLGSGKETTTTVDFLGIGGGTRQPGDLKENRSDEIMQLKGFHSQQKMVGLNQFHHQEQDAIEEKAMWWEA
ncbi:hypothetical protein SAY86_015519 [Trapa natans]|uniref:Uncharacterized protein n=1 Tax=Trapa natans TaxID=22666 RepID=A0AAN7LJV2_TRANT|nr:hypothetical protein SAY86_015519 [Trapa natans]